MAVLPSLRSALGWRARLPAACGSALGLGKAVASAMDATGRQPEAAQKILVNMMAGCALIEALTLYVLIFGFVLMGKI